MSNCFYILASIFISIISKNVYNNLYYFRELFSKEGLNY